jgi:glucosyl-dolichyl phosphate glucuronosyltransferase
VTKTGNLSISVILCAFTEERWDALVAAVNSVKSQTHPALETVLVIDHNPTMLERAKNFFENVVVVENKGSRGCAGARNMGISQSQGDIVVFLDDDAVAYPDWLENIYASYQDEKVVGVGGAIEPLWESSRPNWFPEEFYWVVGCTYRGMPEQAAPVRNLIGANMSFRRMAFEAAGYFDEGLGRVGKRALGCEETELSIRVRQAMPGKILLYNPMVRVQHNVSRQRTEWKYLRSRCYNEGRSKALVSRSVGVKDSLKSEWDYTLKVLPTGVVTGVRDTLRGDRHGVSRAWAITTGLGFTVAGYALGTLSAKMGAVRTARTRTKPQQAIDDLRFTIAD